MFKVQLRTFSFDINFNVNKVKSSPQFGIDYIKKLITPPDTSAVHIMQMMVALFVKNVRIIDSDFNRNEIKKVINNKDEILLAFLLAFSDISIYDIDEFKEKYMNASTLNISDYNASIMHRFIAPYIEHGKTLKRVQELEREKHDTMKAHESLLIKFNEIKENDSSDEINRLRGEIKQLKNENETILGNYQRLINENRRLKRGHDLTIEDIESLEEGLVSWIGGDKSSGFFELGFSTIAEFDEKYWMLFATNIALFIDKRKELFDVFVSIGTKRKRGKIICKVLNRDI